MYHTYEEARIYAQFEADSDGMDRGIETSPMYSYPDNREFYRVFLLPRRENRCGHELRCEVVMCSFIEKCQLGHGPARRSPMDHFDHCEECRSLAYDGETCPAGKKAMRHAM